MGFLAPRRDGPRRPKSSKIAVFSHQRGDCRLLGLVMRPRELAAGLRFESRGVFEFLLLLQLGLKEGPLYGLFTLLPSPKSCT